MFERAARLKVRFNHKGMCTVEDLWDIPLKSLDSIYKGLNAQLKDQKEESLLLTRSPADEILDLQIAIVKHVVTIRLQERKDRNNEVAVAAKKKKVLGIIADKQDEDLKNMSVEDLTKMASEM